MIQSLRKRLQELENAAERPHQSREPQPRVGDSSHAQEQSPGACEATPQTQASYDNDTAGSQSASDAIHPLQATYAAEDIERKDVTSEEAHEPILPATGINNKRHLTQCTGMSIFERLMKPIGIAIEQSANISTVNAGADGTPSFWSEAGSSAQEQAHCDCDRLLETTRWNLPLRRTADRLVAVYFARHARMFPVLHRPTFMKQYEALWQARANPAKVGQKCVNLCRQKSRGKLFPATVNTVFALGAIFSSGCPERNATYSAEFYRDAEAIDVLVLLNEEVGLEFVQLVLIMALYLQSTERFSKCWNMAGLALRMAQEMGLHYSVTEARKRGLLGPFPTQVECEMRTRVWHACILLET
jgi:hypothetical protein